MQLIKGENLTSEQEEYVKKAYIYRWTADNKYRQSSWGSISSKPTIPLISDEQWFQEHAFWFRNDGYLSESRKHAEPVYMAEG